MFSELIYANFPILFFRKKRTLSTPGFSVASFSLFFFFNSKLDFRELEMQKVALLFVLVVSQALCQFLMLRHPTFVTKWYSLRPRQGLVPNFNAPIGFQGSCWRRTCDQQVVGRQLTYSRALEIVQNEEYLSDLDLDIIRRRRTKRQNGNGDGGPPPMTTTSTTTTTVTQATTPPSTTTPFLNENVVRAGGTASLVGMAAAALALPAIPPQLPAGTIPPGNPLPGTAGGGAPPVATTPEAAAALALVPPGLTPVAVFPPFASPRTFPTVSVIFAEAAPVRRRRRRFRRSTWVRYLWNRLQRSHRRRLSTAQFVSSSVRSSFRDLKKKMTCFRARLARSFNLLRVGDNGAMRGAPTFKRQHPKANPPAVTLDQCFDDIPEPKFGFASKVTIVNDQPCVLDVTCDANGNTLFARRRTKIDRQTGEAFFTSAAPDCRAAPDPTNSCF